MERQPKWQIAATHPLHPARPDRAVLVERQPVRHVPPGHGQAPRPGAVRRDAPPPYVGGRRPIGRGSTMTAFDDFRTSPFSG